MIGRPNCAPKLPGLVIVKVPPCTSSGLSFLARARSATSWIAFDRRVDDAMLAQAIDHDLRDERRERELRAHALVFVLLGLANLVDARVADLEHRIDVSGRAPAHDHVLGDLLAHDRHRDDFIARVPGYWYRGQFRRGPSGARPVLSERAVRE